MRRLVDSISTILGATAILLVTLGLAAAAGIARADPPPPPILCGDSTHCYPYGNIKCIVKDVTPIEAGDCDDDPGQCYCHTNFDHFGIIDCDCDPNSV